LETLPWEEQPCRRVEPRNILERTSEELLLVARAKVARGAT
ncbi:hypothetical protein T09_8134, partial [Trichinella sp. T9]